MRILLSGATGFLGKHLKARLEADGHSLDLVGRGANLNWTSHPQVIINCAGELDKVESMVDGNVGLVIDLLEFAREEPGCRVIQIGSSSETGPMEGPRAENAPCHPTNLYEGTKLAATNLCLGYAGQYNMDVCVARPFSLYGSDDKPRKFLPTLWRKAVAGETIDIWPGGHDWLHVDDFVEGIVKLMQAPRTVTQGQIFHFGTGISTSNGRLFRLFQDAMGHPITAHFHDSKYRDYDVADWRAAWSKAQCELGWEPSISIERGVKRFVQEQL